MTEKSKAERLKPLSMDGISTDDALKGAMELPAPDPSKKLKPKAKRKKAKKKAR